MPYGKILIVDDVETNLFTAVELMKHYKLRVETAMSGSEALGMISGGKEYDVIFMDHMMPEMDGIETTRRLRASGYTNPIVALTADDAAGQADMFIENGFDEFISKPIDICRLNSVLNKLMRGKQPLDVTASACTQKNESDTGSDANGEEGKNAQILMRESFIRDARKTAAVLDKMGGRNDYGSEDGFRKFIITVHGVKSALRSIGEIGLSELAYTLELAGRNKNIEEVTGAAPGFLNELYELIDKYEEKHSDEHDDIESLRGMLRSLKTLCADYDRKGALDLLAETTRCSRETRAVLNRIKEHVLHSDFEEAEAAAADFSDKLLVEGISVDGLDMEKGLYRYMGDTQAYWRILRTFVLNIRKMLLSIETVSEESLRDYKITVHGIKGASADIYAGDVNKRAEALEKAAKDGDLDYINKHNKAFHEAANRLIGNLEEAFALIDANNPKPKKSKPDAEALAKLLAACGKYDMDGVDEAMKEIDRYKYEQDEGLAEWLHDNAELMNFTRIAEKLSGMGLQ
jgi:CheY-like chemotaxis protein/HPt (histidine-containing phosphotransfer) domain-containing protein